MAQIKTIYGNEVIDDALRGSVANEYSSSSTYAVGDMVLKEGQLYKCNTAISTAEAWTAAHWTAVTVGGELSTVKDGLSSVENNILTDDIKQALLQIAEKVAYIDEDGQDYYDALEDALYPTAELVSISAVYTQSGTVYDTDSLDSLKNDLVVTAHMSDSTTRTVTAYTLSGTLTEGTSTITVTYSNKTTTFTVAVTRLEIRVFKGKGTSGASIIDNPNRALSEKIDVTGATEIITQWDYSETQDAIKFVASDTTVDTNGYILVPQSYIGTGTAMSPYDTWRTATDDLICAMKISSEWNIQIPSSGMIRLLYRTTNSPSTAIGTISGIITINGKKYHLVEDTAENFE